MQNPKIHNRPREVSPLIWRALMLSKHDIDVGKEVTSPMVLRTRMEVEGR